MPFFNSSSPVQGGLPPEAMRLIAMARAQGSSEDEIAQFLESSGFNPDDYEEDLVSPLTPGFREPASVPDIANYIWPGDSSYDGLPDDVQYDDGTEDPGYDPAPFPLKPVRMGASSAAFPQPPATTVEDTFEPDPNAPVDPAMNVQPDPAPVVGIEQKDAAGVGAEQPKEEPGIGQRVLGLLSSGPMAEALMATGFGMLGAQNTYGNLGAAVGQGGLKGVEAFGLATRRGQKERAAEMQAKLAEKRLVAQEEAQKRSRLNSKLNVLSTFASKNPEAAKAYYEKNPDLQAELGNMDSGVLLKGEKGKPSVIRRKDGVYLVDPATMQATRVGGIPAEPETASAGRDGRFTKQIQNPETGVVEEVLFDRDGNQIRTLGYAKPTGGGPRVTVDPKTGQITFDQSGGKKMNSTMAKTALDKFRSAEAGAVTAKKLIRAISDENIGIAGDLRQTTFGALAQGKTLLGMVARSLQSETERAIAESGRKDLVNANIFDPNRSAIKVFGDTLAIMMQRASGDTRLSDFDMKNAKARTGLDESLANSSDVIARIENIYETMLEQAASAASDYETAGGPNDLRENALIPIPTLDEVRDRIAGGGKRKSKDERWQELRDQLGSDDAANEAMAKEELATEGAR